MGNAESSAGVRLDRWLWAARMFKTRQLAVDAIRGGKVQINGVRAKPARVVRVGDRVDLTRGHEHFTLHVLGLSDKRGPAPVAQALYEETDESRRERQRNSELNRVAAGAVRTAPGRPTKRDRRLIRRFVGED